MEDSAGDAPASLGHTGDYHPTVLTDTPVVWWGRCMMRENTHTLKNGHIRALIVALVLLVSATPLFAQSGGNGSGAPSVSDEELTQFAGALQTVRDLQQQMASDSQASVADSDMGEARFQELYQARQSGSDPETPATDAESAEFDQIMQELQQIQQASNQQMVEAVQEQGLDVQRFNEIAQAIQQSPDLMQRLQQLASPDSGS